MQAQGLGHADKSQKFPDHFHHLPQMRQHAPDNHFLDLVVIYMLSSLRMLSHVARLLLWLCMATFSFVPLRPGRAIGIHFAAPPLRRLCFQKPQLPVVTPGVQQADTFRSVCYGTGASLSSTSKNCLFLNVWVPSGTTSTSKFSVFFWI